jgi:hypothetical protein
MKKSTSRFMFTFLTLTVIALSSCQEENVQPVNSPRDAASGLSTGR